MAMTTGDLMLRLNRKAIQIQLWSSDPLFDGFPNRLVKTTLDNTIQDIKEVISQRSYKNGGDFNPPALKIFFRHKELPSYEPLSQCLDSVDYPIRLRVEFIGDRLSPREIIPPLLNVNIHTSSGKMIHSKVQMSTKIHSLKCSVVDDLHLKGLDDIVKVEFNGGVRIEDDKASLSKLLDLDTVPFGELNLFVTMIDDFKIKLTSPTEGALKTSFMSVNLDTTIFTVKKYILDQYTGNNANVTTDEIKVIHFGRILEDEIRMRNITIPNSSAMMVLHFVLQEPETASGGNGFWTDLKSGNIFDFYPKHPNPHFTVEYQRTQRLKEQFRINNHQDEQYLPDPDRSQSIFVPDDPDFEDVHHHRELTVFPDTRASVDADHERIDSEESLSDDDSEAYPLDHIEPLNLLHIGRASTQEQFMDSPGVSSSQSHVESHLRKTLSISERQTLERFLRSHRLPEGANRTGTSYDLISQNGEQFLADELETSGCVYKVAVDTPYGSREVMLSSSQCVVNDTDPEHPYLMVSKSGYAKLLQLGVEIQEPEIQRQRIAHRVQPRIQPTAPIDEINELFNIGAENGHNLQGHVPPQHQGQNHAVLNGNWNLRDLGRQLETFVRLTFNIAIFLVVYSSTVQPYMNSPSMHIFTILVGIAYALSYPRLRTIVGNLVRRQFPELTNSIQRRFDDIHLLGIKERAKMIFVKAIELSYSPAIPQPLRTTYRFCLDFFLFFATLVPSVHALFATAIREIRDREDVLLARTLQEIAQQAVDAVPQDDDVPDDDINQGDHEHIEALRGGEGATGIQLHPED
jgi:hypothetical protein